MKKLIFILALFVTFFSQNTFAQSNAPELQQRGGDIMREYYDDYREATRTILKQSYPNAYADGLWIEGKNWLVLNNFYNCKDSEFYYWSVLIQQYNSTTGKYQKGVIYYACPTKWLKNGKFTPKSLANTTIVGKKKAYTGMEEYLTDSEVASNTP
ncbi:hypothetical protein CL684_00395 [Candidatus Campbellbacteria bacterium]|nr:hypothetical protein [Candidatus Campbellbacteria bacterium]